MGFSDNKVAKYPGALGDLLPVMDKLASSVFETSAKTINTGDETYTVPTSTPYAIRLRYVPKETRDGSGNPIGVAIAGMTEIAWSDTAAPSTAQFMVNYLNGEVKFSAASAGASVQPAYQGVESRVWAETMNEVLRELKKVQEILGTSVQGSYATAKARMAATESEIQTARGGKANLDDRLDQIEADIGPLSGATFTAKEPSAATGVLGTAALELTSDLYLDEDTITNNTVKLKDSAEQPVALTVGWNKTTKKITATHAALPDDVYTAYTEAGINDVLGRALDPVSWRFGVGAAVANDAPEVTNGQVLNQTLNGFTAKGAISNPEGTDTITRIDVAYSQGTNPDAASILQYSSQADINAFLGAGLSVVVALTAGDWNVWYRAAESWQGGGGQTGPWCAIIPFTVSEVQNEAPSAPVIALVSEGDTVATIRLTAASTDAEDGTITLYDAYKDGALHAADITLNLNDTYQYQGLTNDQTYQLTLKAKDSAGALSAASNAVSATPTAFAYPYAMPNDYVSADGGGFKFKKSGTYATGTETSAGVFALDSLDETTTRANNIVGVSGLVKGFAAADYTVAFNKTLKAGAFYTDQAASTGSILICKSDAPEIMSLEEYIANRKVTLTESREPAGNMVLTLMRFKADGTVWYWTGSTWLTDASSFYSGTALDYKVNLARVSNGYTVEVRKVSDNSLITSVSISSSDVRFPTDADKVFLGDAITDNAGATASYTHNCDTTYSNIAVS